VVETKYSCQFKPTEENELFLSLVETAWHSQIINTALSRYLSQEALIDIADGKGVVSFWRKLSSKKKEEVLRRFKTGAESELVDPDLWAIVGAGELRDFFLMAAKYLKLYQLKYGVVWTASEEITGVDPLYLR